MRTIQKNLHLLSWQLKKYSPLYPPKFSHPKTTFLFLLSPWLSAAKTQISHTQHFTYIFFLLCKRLLTIQTKKKMPANLFFRVFPFHLWQINTVVVGFGFELLPLLILSHKCNIRKFKNKSLAATPSYYTQSFTALDNIRPYQRS